jgi:2-amino-4-ketopentanoate thiolase alpha subunit
MSLIKKGEWVRIQRTVLESNERKIDLPESTRKLPLNCWVNGFLMTPASLGDEVEIVTLIGRRVSGILHNIQPWYNHGFGRPVPQLYGVGSLLSELLEDVSGDKNG